MSAPKDRGEAAAHAARLELATELALKAWQTMTQRFAELSSLKVADHILHEARNNAIDSFEALLDAVKTESDAHRLLQAMRQTNPRRPPPRQNPLARKPNDPRKPKDDA